MRYWRATCLNQPGEVSRRPWVESQSCWDKCIFIVKPAHYLVMRLTHSAGSAPEIVVMMEVAPVNEGEDGEGVA
jgi:hypothetical protein